MKIVRNYRKLKKWAKSLFVAMLTICIIFTSTGVWSLVAYAEPENSTEETTPEPEGNTDNTEGTGEGTQCTHTGTLSYVFSMADAADMHAVICNDCNEKITDEYCDYITEGTPNGDGTHVEYLVCTKCGGTLTVPAASAVQCTPGDDGRCTVCGGTVATQTSSLNNVGRLSLGSPMLTSPATPMLGSPAPGQPGASNNPIDSGDDISPFFSSDSSTQPQAYASTLAYTGSALDVFYTGRTATPHNLVGSVSDVTYQIVITGPEGTTYPYTGRVYSASTPGQYTMTITVLYKDWHDDKYYVRQRNFTAKVLKDIAHPDITITGGETIDFYDYLSTWDLTLTDGATTLDRYLDFEIDDSSVPATENDFVTAGTTYTVTITGTGYCYTGSRTVTLNVPDPAITKAGQMDSTNTFYFDKVTLSSTGYTVGLSSNGTFASTVDYDTETNGNKDVTVYLKKAGNPGLTKTETLNVKVIPLKYNNSATKLASYSGDVVVTADGYLISDSNSGPFTGSYTFNQNSGTVSRTLYFKSRTDPSGAVISKAVDVTINRPTIPIRYNGEESPNGDGYPNKVDITAQGYLVGTSQTGPFSQKYTHKTVGNNQAFYLWFKPANSSTAPTQVLIENITIYEQDIEGPSAKITVDDYSSRRIAAEKDTVYITREKREIEITATSNSSTNSAIDKIEYFTSENYYESKSEIEGAITDGKAKWKTYYSDSKPTLTENTAVYIYAKITDEDGNTQYVSTGKVIYDKEKPVVDNGILSEKAGSGSNGTSGTSGSSSTSANVTRTDNGAVLAVTGTDTLSGIESFYMVYQPYKDGAVPPKAEEVIANGQKVDVEVRDGKVAAASYNLSGLLSDVKYTFYIVAKDKAGNISEVKVVDADGKGGLSSKDVSGNSIDSPSGGSGGLAPAPNGIAGSGNVTKPSAGSGSSSSSASSSSSESSQSSPLDREINRIPYISDATGDTKIGLEATGGWDRITGEVSSAQAGTSIDVEMSGYTVVPAAVLSAMRGKDVRVTFQLPDDIEWRINGEDISTVSGADMDMGVRLGARNIPLDMLDAVTGTYPHTEMELLYDGPLGFKGKLRIPLGEINSGMYAHLYYYDTDAREMVLMQSTVVNAEGIAEFDFEHASDYSIVIRPEEMLMGSAGSTEADTQEQIIGMDAYSTIRLSDAVGSAASVRIWLFSIAVISALLCGAILFIPGLQNPETARQDY